MGKYENAKEVMQELWYILLRNGDNTDFFKTDVIARHCLRKTFCREEINAHDKSRTSLESC